MFGPGLIVVIALLVAACGAGAAAVVRPVDRRRVQRFATRQALMITVTNGNAVIRYLAVTRRWRGGLLGIALLLSCGYFLLSRHELDVNGVSVFCGWFVGAVIAEGRVDSLARSGRAGALLHRRRVQDYVPRQALAACVAVVAVAAVVLVLDVLVTMSRSHTRPLVFVLPVVALLAATVIATVARRVLHRPQPLTAPDLLDADNAIRARSLNVLAGSAVAIAGYFAASSVREVVGSGSATAVVAALLGYVAAPLLGVIVARAPRRRPVRLTPSAVIG